MKGTALSLVIILAALVILAAKQGRDTLLLGVRSSLDQLAFFLPVLVVALLITGFAEALLPKKLIETWLSDASGWRGLVVAWAAGILTPGGSMIGLPMVAALYRAGVGISVLITYATSFFILSLIRVPLEIGFYGWRVTALRWAVSVTLPFIAGLLARALLPLARM